MFCQGLLFPVLPEPQSDEGYLLYQDWLVVVSGLVCDVSDSATEWWSRVLTAVDQAYKVWISSSPIDRLRVEPNLPADLLQGRWLRVNFRVCSMLMAAIPEGIRADIVACKSNSSAPAILFRLHTTYQPGGGAEKALILKSLRDPLAAQGPASALKILRYWVRWYNRCVDCGMSPPDSTVLCQGLTTITSLILAKHEEFRFRTFMLRSMLKIEAQPTMAAVLEYHCHLLAEVEALVSSQVLEDQAGTQDVQSEQQSSQTSQSDQDEEEQDQVQLAASTSAVPHAPGEIPSREESFQALATVFQTALQVVRAAQHSSHPSGPQASLPSLAPPAQEEASQPQLALPAAQTSQAFPEVLQGINQALAAVSGTHASNAPDPKSQSAKFDKE